MTIVLLGESCALVERKRTNVSYRLSAGTIIFYLFFGTYYLTQIVSYVFEVLRLVDMYRFYTHLLGIPDVSSSYLRNKMLV